MVLSGKNQRTEAHEGQKGDPCTLLSPLHLVARDVVPQGMLSPQQGSVRSQWSQFRVERTAPRASVYQS